MHYGEHCVFKDNPERSEQTRKSWVIIVKKQRAYLVKIFMKVTYF